MAGTDGSSCVAGACANPCQLRAAPTLTSAAQTWAVPTATMSRSLLKDPYAAAPAAVGVEGFPFAVALANPGRRRDRHDRRRRAEGDDDLDDCCSCDTRVIKLPWVLDLVGAPTERGDGDPPTGTRVVAHGGYHIVSNVPIVAYQLNPLHLYRSAAVELLADLNGDANCYSYSNDASLLLPASVLGTK